MRKWGLVVTLLYAVVVVALLSPALLLLVGAWNRYDFQHFYGSGAYWTFAGVFMLCQAVLLLLRADPTAKPSRARTRIVITASVTGLLLMMVVTVVVFSAVDAAIGEKKLPELNGPTPILATAGSLWLLWGILFYFLYRNSTDPVTRALAWLFRGSVLELLVAVPAHVIARRRDECCAPMVTGFGIISGIAIMLLSFGPSVALLFKKRMERYEHQGSGTRGQGSVV